MKLFTFEQFVNESRVTEALAVSNRGISGDTLLVSINGNEYGYGTMKGGPDLEELSRKFSKMMTFSVGKALAWLKKNAELVKGSAKNESEDIEATVGELVYEGLEEFENQISEREVSAEEREKLADKGYALPDGSFPIANVEDLKNAIKAYGRAKDQAAAAKHIAKRAKALGAEDLIPQSEDFQKSLKESSINEDKVKDMHDKASKLKSELAELKSKKASPASIAAKEEQLKRAAKALRNLKADAYESSVNEAKFKPMGLSKEETLKVAKLYAEAISKLEGKKCTVNMDSLEEDSFDLDLPGDEYAGGSYSIDSDGNVYNDGMGVGMKTPPIYGKYDDSVATIVKNIKKVISELGWR